MDKAKNASLLWLDMEMTGLDPAVDKVVEIAAIATDWDFNELASYQSGVNHPIKTVTQLFNNSPFYKKYPDNQKALLELISSSPPESQVQRQLGEFVREYFSAEKPPLLAGNSIHQDRRFIRAYYPQLDALLHYRMLDVSAWKVVFEAKYKKRFIKSEVHRALGDVRESIAELKYYMSFFEP